MNNSLSAVWPAFCLVMALVARPAIGGSLPLQHVGNTTYDPNTGLQWLDLNQTAGQSYDSILNGWNGFTTTAQFRFATRSEIIQLFANAGAGSLGSPTGPPNAANLQAGNLILSLLGTTLPEANGARSWMFYDPLTEPTLPTSVHIPAAVFGVGVVRAGYPQEGFFLVPGIFPTRDYSSAVMASALVRMVPEPATGMLAGLGLIFFMSSRSHRSWHNSRRN